MKTTQWVHKYLWDRSISANAMFVHQLNQFTLLEEKLDNKWAGQNKQTDLKIVWGFGVFSDSVKVPDGDPCPLS